MDTAYAPDRHHGRAIQYSALGLLTISGILLMATKSDLLNGIAHSIFSTTGDCDPNELMRIREEILDLDEKIHLLQGKYDATALAAEREYYQNIIDELSVDRARLIEKSGHCSGWGNS